MEDHHRQSIVNTVNHFDRDPEVLGLLLGGSLAHGFATASSDVDVMILVSDDTYQRRVADHQLTFFSRELCTYPAGYVDGKYISRSYLDEVRAKGSEPARFAFQDAQVLVSRVDDLAGLLADIARYPREHKAERLVRFYAQLEAWHWYSQEALKHQNRYLLNLAVSKLTLFGGRLILAHNERLYPFHKWFLRVLAQAPAQPAGLAERIQALCAQPTAEAIEEFYDLVKNFRAWETPAGGWPAQFMLDSEWNWKDGQTPVDDV